MSNSFVYVVGNRGNMARRYTAILDHLGVDHCGHDRGEEPNEGNLASATHIIIATPTLCHLADIVRYGRYGKPILCEKPFTTDVDELWKFEREHRTILPLISMVNQYAQLTSVADAPGLSSYDYFKSGGDGLIWDCINIIGLARGEIKLRNASPIWKCQINGRPLSIAGMDYAYVDMIVEWLRYPVSNFEYAKIAHAKVVNIILEGIE